MIGIGTLINTGSIIIGSILGLTLKHNLKEKYKLVMIQSVGLATILIGISGTLQGIFVINSDLSIKTTSYIILILSMVIGGVIGAFLKIEESLMKFSEKIQNKFKSQKQNIANGFVSASLIFCVGAMAITGSINDGMTGDYSLLLTKSMLDGITSMILASTLGIGVLLSALSVLFYQGFITITAHLLGAFIPDIVKNQMSLIGNVLIVGIGLEIIQIKKLKVADMLPAIFIPLFYYFIKLIFNF